VLARLISSRVGDLGFSWTALLVVCTVNAWYFERGNQAWLFTEEYNQIYDDLNHKLWTKSSGLLDGLTWVNSCLEPSPMSKGYLASQAYNTALFRFLPFPLHLYSECNSKPPSSDFSHRLCLFLLCENDFEKFIFNKK